MKRPISGLGSWLPRPAVLVPAIVAAALFAVAPAVPTVARQSQPMPSDPILSARVTDTTRPVPAQDPTGHAEPIDLVANAILHGDEAGSNLELVSHGKTFFDYNGDGLKDFLVTYLTRAFHPELRHEHLDIVFGRTDWPEHVGISELPNRMSVEIPDPDDQDPGDSLYDLVKVTDLNGDGKHDLVVKVTEYRRERVTAVELDTYYGREDWKDELDVTAVAPDFRIRQPRPPFNDTEAKRTRMPDKVGSADLNGDGKKDLIVSSCEYEAEGQDEGAMFIYFGPFDTDGMLDLKADEPDAAVYSSDEFNVCTAKVEKLDGDGAADILVAGSSSRRQQEFHYGGVVYGRATWEPANDVSDLVGTRIVNNTKNGDVDVSAKDINGDGKKDIVGKAWVYKAPKWDEQVECVWFGGGPLPDVLDTNACDFRFTDKWPMEFVDINGDGALDYFFEMDQRGTDPFVWRVGLGPIEAGGEMSVGDDPDSGDYVLTLPYGTDPMSWKFGNVNGDSNKDLLLLEPEERFQLPETGVIKLHMGPLVPVPVPPTHTPTPVPPPTETPTATPTIEPPTATPTVEPPTRIYLPISKKE